MSGFLINPYRFGGALLLDAVPTALFAYSFRLLRTAYVGQCCRIYRNSDAAEQDIGFSGGVVDTAAIASFCSGTTGRLWKWYDQSGNGNDALAQTHPAPTGTESYIYEGGAVNAVNGKTAFRLYNNSSSNMNLPSGLWNNATAISLLMVLKLSNPAGSNRGIFGPNTTSGTGIEVLQTKVISVDTLLRINNTNRTSGSNLLCGDDIQSLTEIYGDGSSVSAYYNNSSVTLSNSTALPTLNFNGIYAIGRYANQSTYTVDGYFQEVIGYSASKSADRSTIASNINNYYSIY